MAKIVISILSFGRPALAANVVRQIKAERRRIGSEFGINVIIGLNESRSGRARRYWEKEKKPRWVSIVRHDHNLGFGGGHNHAFHSNPSDIFIALNDDLEFTGKGWLRDLLRPILSGDAALVGASESPCRLTADLDGTWRKPGDKRPPDYVEASILAVNSEDARKLGLFAPDLDLAYFEDSDLSLRFRQAGKRIRAVSIPHVHQRGVSASLLSSDLLERVRRGNQVRVRNRWERAVRNRRITNRVAVVLDSIGWGDVIASLPAVLQLALDHPAARVDVHVADSVRRFFTHPRLTLRPLVKNGHLKADGYDRIWHLSSTPFQTPDHLGATIAASLGVLFSSDLATTHLRRALPALPATTETSIAPIAIVHAECGRCEFEGRQPSQRAFISAVDLLARKGFHTILVGVDRRSPDGNALAKRCALDMRGKTSLWGLARLMSWAQLCLCTDSGPLHLAQLFHVPTFAVFGSTLPTSKLTWWDNSASFQANNLPCLGCYHLLGGAPCVNMCPRRDIACMTQWSANDLAKAVEAFLGGTYSGFQAAARSETQIRTRLMEQHLHAAREMRIPEFFNQPQEEGRETIVIFGAGEAGRRALGRLPADLTAIGFCDNDPVKWNTRLEGLPVVAPSVLGRLPFSKIVIASQYHPQIAAQLLKSGISPQRIRIVRTEKLRPLTG
jgi:GT2 family glycosyltransferase